MRWRTRYWRIRIHRHRLLKYGNTIAIERVHYEKEIAMKKDDQEILREVQKNTDMAIRAIDTISEKICDEELRQELSKEKLLYSVIQNKATDRLQSERAEGYHGSTMQDLMLKGGIQMNTLTNCSTSKIAELMIQGSSRGITNMWKSINHHQNSGNTSMEVARELVDFEEKSIGRLKKFL